MVLDRGRTATNRNILSSSRGAPEPSTTRLDYGFSQLLELATALWQYECAIPHEFSKFRRLVETKTDADKLAPPKDHRQCLQWLFVAVVFERQLTFEKYCFDIFVKYDHREKIITADEYRTLPEDFRGRFVLHLLKFEC